MTSKQETLVGMNRDAVCDSVSTAAATSTYVCSLQYSCGKARRIEIPITEAHRGLGRGIHGLPI
jgi:hypothetical protein